MNGPSPAFLANIFAAGEQLAGVGPTSPAPFVSVAGQRPQLPPMLTPPAGSPTPQAPPPAPPPPSPHEDPARGMSVMPPAAPAASQGPAPPPPAPPADPMAPRPLPGGNAYPLVQVGGGGVIPAHEVERRGPTLRKAQDSRNAASNDTIGLVEDRNLAMAEEEYNAHLDLERQAQLRQAAAEQAAAERQQEMVQRQADFDQSVKAMSQMHVDPNRFWASRTTDQKIASALSLAVGGFLQGINGGSNPAMDALNIAIERDIKAQELDFMAAKDTVNAKQTAFSMAMSKYQNMDAARAAARAAALEAAQAKLAGISARWKGTDAANRADMARAALEDERMQQIAQGIQFVLPQQVGRTFVDARTGLRYNEQEAKNLVGKIDERDFENRKQTAGIGGQLLVENAKIQGTADTKADDGAKMISTQLQQAGVPQARAAAEMALAALNKSPGGKLEAGLRSGLGGASNAVLSEEANAREQAYANFKNAAIKAMMGNATESEVARAEAALGSAANPEARKRAINMALQTLEEIEKNAKAGASPAAQAEFDRRREVAKGDKQVAPTSAKKGW